MRRAGALGFWFLVGQSQHNEQVEKTRNQPLEALFVGGGAVERGDWDIQQTQVDGELSAMVDEVVEDHAAQDRATRLAE